MEFHCTGRCCTRPELETVAEKVTLDAPNVTGAILETAVVVDVGPILKEAEAFEPAEPSNAGLVEPTDIL
jgi:hypothetical protein